MGARRVGDDFDTIQRHVDMRRLGRKQFFARLKAKTGVWGAQNHVADGDFLGALQLLDHVGQVVVLDMLWPAPWDEVAVLAVVAIVGKEQLGADKEDTAVQDDDSAVEAVVAVHDGHANVADDAMERRVGHDDGHLLPGMEVGVGFEDCQSQPWHFYSKSK